MRVLFIGFKYNNFCGGQVCSSRNLRILKRVCGEENVYEFKISRNIRFKKKNKLFWYIKGFWNDIRMCSIGGYDNDQRKQLFHLVESNKIDTVFIDNSSIGNIAKEIKKSFPHIKIISFFHNSEYLYYKREFEVNGNYLFKYRNCITKQNEKNACKYSDKLIVLNERDLSIINSLYGKKADFIIPITLKDIYKASNVIAKKDIVKTGLFIGSYFSLNVEGISFFIKEVLPHVEMKLIIVGTGMSKLKEDIAEDSKLEIIDFVEDLFPYYEKADFMVMPILSGSGMKVKTAEALMYGKYIIGTSEAFSGYIINEDIACRCDSAADFINAINNYDLNSQLYNEASRNLFLKYYTDESSFLKFEEAIKSIEE